MVKNEAILINVGNEIFIKIALVEYRISSKIYFLWGVKEVIVIFSHKYNKSVGIIYT